jgi:tRNA(Ile)-lysidine synthase
MTEPVVRALDAALAGIGTARVAVAFSGGRDSTVLLDACVRAGARVRAWHVNHHIHPDSDAWQRHVEAVCREHGIECTVDHVQVATHRAVEEAARSERYRVWRERLGDGDVLLLAHHLDDQIETVLWRLVRGSGAELLRGMPHRRPLGNGVLLRPFLDLPGAALAEYAAVHALRWIEDPANADARHDRSFLRVEIVPRLAARFPHAPVGIADSARALGRDAAIVEAWLDERLGELGATPDALPVDALLHPHGERLLRRWLVQRGVRGVPASRLRTAVEQSNARESRSPSVVVAQGLALRRHRGAWRLVPDVPPFTPIVWPLSMPLELPHGRLEADRADDGELTPRVTEVVVRMRRAGDSLAPGRHGTHRLKERFRQAGIPPWERATYPVIVVDDEVAMIPGVGVAVRYAAHGAGWRVRWRPRQRP